LPEQYGRYSTRRSGSGTSINPYTIEFLDSEEFTVEAGQIHSSVDFVINSNTTAFKASHFDTIDYETPTEIFMATTLHLADGDGALYLSYHKFWFVTAEATFISNGTVAGLKSIFVVWHPPSGSFENTGHIVNGYGPMDFLVVTGNSSSGESLTEDITLSCSGLMPFVNLQENINFFSPGGVINVYVEQSSGSPMTVRNIKFTLVAI
jgi:hypothetical protein